MPRPENLQVVPPRDSRAGGDSSLGPQSAVQSSHALVSAQSAPPTPTFPVPEPEQTVEGGSAKPEDVPSLSGPAPYGLKRRSTPVLSDGEACAASRPPASVGAGQSALNLEMGGPTAAVSATVSGEGYKDRAAL